jgi:hypothetical protein
MSDGKDNEVTFTVVLDSLLLLSKEVVRVTIAAGWVLDFCGDAIVNAANECFIGGFGVDEAVNKAGGFELKQVRRKLLGGCPTTGQQAR